jgi:hypothetical protein
MWPINQALLMPASLRIRAIARHEAGDPWRQRIRRGKKIRQHAVALEGAVQIEKRRLIGKRRRFAVIDLIVGEAVPGAPGDRMLVAVLVVGELETKRRAILSLPHHEVHLVAVKPAATRFAGHLPYPWQFAQAHRRWRLAVFRWNAADRRGEFGVRRPIHRPELARRAGRVLAKEVVALPVARRAYRTWLEAASAIRADIAQYRVDASRAEGTFVGADARLGRIRRQARAAMLATGSQFQHARFGSGYPMCVAFCPDSGAGGKCRRIESFATPNRDSRAGGQSSGDCPSIGLNCAPFTNLK